MLSAEASFPADLLDEILCWSCEGSPRRALDLARVNSYWHSRFCGCDRLWALLAPRLMRFPVGRRNPTYDKIRRSVEVAMRFPFRTDSLHPIEDCDFHFRCPVYLENLKEVAPGVSYCDICNKNVYQVKSQEEVEYARQNKLCVRMRVEDLAPGAMLSPTAVAVLAKTEEEGRRAMTELVAAAQGKCQPWEAKERSWELPLGARRSGATFPILLVEEPNYSPVGGFEFRFLQRPPASSTPEAATTTTNTITTQTSGAPRERRSVPSYAIFLGEPSELDNLLSQSRSRRPGPEDDYAFLHKLQDAAAIFVYPADRFDAPHCLKKLKARNPHFEIAGGIRFEPSYYVPIDLDQPTIPEPT
jgi:hypothetical protein